MRETVSSRIIEKAAGDPAPRLYGYGELLADQCAPHGILEALQRKWSTADRKEF